MSQHGRAVQMLGFTLHNIQGFVCYLGQYCIDA